MVLMVNLSARQLHDPGLADQVKRILNKYHLPVGCLHIEITETTMMADVEGAKRTLSALRGMGVRIAVDDFGTGHAWFEYLNQLEVDAIKIDRSFVRGITESNYSRGLVRAIITFAKEIGLTVYAEGIETAAQFECLQSLTCDKGQGYYFGRPEPPDRIEALLEEMDKSTMQRQRVGA